MAINWTISEPRNTARCRIMESTSRCNMRSDLLAGRFKRLLHVAPEAVVCLVLITGSLFWTCSAGANAQEVVSKAANLRRDGNYRLAIDLLEAERARTGESCSARVLGELGAAYFQAHRLTEAEPRL